MPYYLFLLLFVLLPALLLAWIARPTRREWLYIGLLVLAAYIWTTPWDNYLVATGVWSYAPDLVLGINLGWVPLEEYLFFGIMTVLSGCLTLILRKSLMSRPRLSRWLAISSVLVLVVALLNLQAEGASPGSKPFVYLTLILVWAAPVVLGQIIIGWRSLIYQWPLWILTALLPTLYLTAMDSIALNSGTWQISPLQSLNLFLPGRIPIEEGIFFFMTNLMIVQGLLLALDPQVKYKAGLWFSSIRSRWVKTRN